MESSAKGSFKVTLLGTGAPPPLIERFGPCTLVEAGGEKFLFDAGRGALQRLFQLGIPFKDVSGLFLTHLHSDHVVGIPDLWLTGRIGRPWGARTVPLPVWGPAGTREMMSYLEKAFQFDIGIRNKHYQRQGAEVLAEDVGEGVVYEKSGLKIVAFEVNHGPLVKPAFGYRIDYTGRSVVLSGDTCYNENLICHSRGADLLVHEVATASEDLQQSSAQMQKILGNHTPPEQAGEVFAQVQPKLAVFSHVLLFDGSTEKDVMIRTRKTYSGPVEMGEDLMTVEVGEEVRIRRFTW